MFIIGGSKSKKSFTALQTSLHVVSGGKAGMPFDVPKEGMTVVLFNPEIKGHHLEKRVQRMARKLGISKDALSRLHIAHRRGLVTDEEQIIATAKYHKADVIIIDPAYKLFEWDEKDVGPWLAKFDRIVEATNALLIIVHHEKKGVAGDRQGIDRGAGDGKMQRDYDCALLLAPQRDEPEDCLVFSQIQRNYAPADPVVMRFDFGAFEPTELPAIEATSQSQRAQGGKKVPPIDAIVRMIDEHGPFATTEFNAILVKEGCTTRGSRPFIDGLLRLEEGAVFEMKERKPGGRKMICNLSQKLAMEAKGEV